MRVYIYIYTYIHTYIQTYMSPSHRGGFEAVAGEAFLAIACHCMSCVGIKLICCDNVCVVFKRLPVKLFLLVLFVSLCGYVLN